MRRGKDTWVGAVCQERDCGASAEGILLHSPLEPLRDARHRRISAICSCHLLGFQRLSIKSLAKGKASSQGLGGKFLVLIA